MPNHKCIKHLRSVVQMQQTKIADLEKTAAEHKHQLAEQVRPTRCIIYRKAVLMCKVKDVARRHV